MHRESRPARTERYLVSSLANSHGLETSEIEHLSVGGIINEQIHQGASSPDRSTVFSLAGK